MSRDFGNQDATAFHLRLLMKMMNVEKHPLIKLIIENNMTKEEYDALFRLLESLDREYVEQKEEGLLDFSSLLAHFADVIPERLDPACTIAALKKEGYYPSLMTEFEAILKEQHLR